MANLLTGLYRIKNEQPDLNNFFGEPPSVTEMTTDEGQNKVKQRIAFALDYGYKNEIVQAEQGRFNG